MMTFPEALRAHFADSIDLSSLVPTERMFPVMAPPRPTEALQPYQDALVYSLDNRSSELADIDGQGPAETTWEITIFSSDYDRAYAISDALIVCLHSYQGPMPSSGGVVVQSSALLNCSDDYDLELRVFLMRHSFQIIYVP